MVKRSHLPDETDSDQFQSFDLSMIELLSVPDFRQTLEFCVKELKVAQSKIDVERDRGKKTKADVVAKTVMGETLNPFVDQEKH